MLTKRLKKKFSKCSLLVCALCCMQSIVAQIIDSSPYNYTIDPADTMTNPEPTELKIKFKLPSFISPSPNHIRDNYYKTYNNRKCILAGVIYEGVRIDCMSFADDVTNPQTEEELVINYLCGYTCEFNTVEGVWEAEIKVGKVALARLNSITGIAAVTPSITPSVKLSEFFNNDSTPISASVSFHLTTDFLQGGVTLPYSSILEKFTSVETISTEDLHGCTYKDMILNRNSITINTVLCNKTAGGVPNIADIFEYRTALFTAQGAGSGQLITYAFQALHGDCTASAVSPSIDVTYPVGTSKDEQFKICMNLCNQNSSTCAGFSFHPQDSLSTNKCNFKVSDCSGNPADNSAILVNRRNIVDNEWIFYRNKNKP